jgi:4-amino-4-deoxy-L-arabinose transferase-like glycosyltransferase
MPLIVMALILLFVCFYGLNRVALIDPVDEGIYSTIARQMVESGDWVTPRYGTLPFFYKPPLLYWCQAVFIHVLGPTPLAARLPSAIAAFLTSLSLFYWARQKGAMRAGELAAILYIICPLVALGLARVAMMDSLLTLFLTLAVIGWIEGYNGKRKGYLLMAVGMGLATMTKGMIGFLLPGAAFSVWLLVRRDWNELRKVPWVSMLGIFMLLVLPWHLAAWRANGNWFLQEYVVRQHIQRFLGEDFRHHAAPIWYYFPVLFFFAFPWSAFVPLAWWRSVRQWRSEKQSADCAMAMWAVWSAVVILFFSFSRSKLPNYVLPALPGLMLLVAWRLDVAWQAKRGLSIFEAIISAGLGLLLGLLLLMLGVSASGWQAQGGSPSWLAKKAGAILNWKEESQGIDLLWQKLTVVTSLAPYLIVLGALLSLGSIMVLILWRQTSRAAGSAIMMSLALIVLGVHFGMPAWSSQTAAPLNALGQRTLPALERGEPLVMYALHPKRPSLRYLLGHTGQIVETFSAESLQSVLKDAGRGYVLTAHDATLPPLPYPLWQEATAGRWVLWRYDGSAR